MDLTKYYPDIVAKYPAYVTKRELCEICHICPKTAYNLEQQGEIPYTIEQNHLIRSHKIKLTDILAYAPAEGGLHEAFCLDPDPVNLASFIVKMGKERGDLMICTPLDTPFLNTVGMFTDQCVDFDFLQDHLLPVLIPMQMGKTEPQEIKLTEDQDNEAFLDDFAVEDDMEL